MHDSAISPEQVKNFLERCKEDLKAVNLMRKRLDALESKTGSPRTAQLTGMPGSGGNPVDVVGRAVSMLDTLRAALADAEIQLQEQQRRAAAMIDLLRSNRCRAWPEKQLALSMRYVDGADIQSITFALFGGLERYADNYETYQRRTFGLLREGIKDLAMYADPAMLDDYD